MQRFEYKVVPAPDRGQKARGVKTAEARFAHAMTQTLNTLATEGWEYYRAETLPCAESRGFFGGGRDGTVHRSLLVFRRPLAAAATEPTEARLPLAVTPETVPAERPTATRAVADAMPPRPRSRMLMAIPSDRPDTPDSTPADKGPAPVLRADRSAPTAEAGPAPDTASGPVFRWPLRPGAGEPQPPRPVHRGD